MSGEVFLVVPFMLLLVALAAAPLAWPEHWEKPRTKAHVIAWLSFPAIGGLVLGRGALGREALGDAGRDYVGFVSYLGALYVIATGIRLRGAPEATPAKNALLLVAGGALASVVGTAGASLLLVRPLLAANRRSEDRALPVIFFIFIVANGGGLLTPLGDPPLFLGFLRGVPFLWPLENLILVWATFVSLAVGAYLAIAWLRSARPQAPPPGEPVTSEPLRVEGLPNVALLCVLVACSFFSGEISAWWVSSAAFIALAVASLVAAPPSRREGFSWDPLLEVVIVFAGVFATLAPVMPTLREHGSELGLRTPLQFFLVSGALSSVLDNAPTYLVLLETAASANGAQGHPVPGVGTTAVPAAVLGALSAGCVLMGANTYIGNGPNFLVRSLAEHEGVKMPGFFRYMAWSLAVLGPIYAVIALVFFR
jgi:Na+/H+ antiporter NhaD/arsenite permease-like protein